MTQKKREWKKKIIHAVEAWTCYNLHGHWVKREPMWQTEHNEIKRSKDRCSLRVKHGISQERTGKIQCNLHGKWNSELSRGKVNDCILASLLQAWISKWNQIFIMPLLPTKSLINSLVNALLGQAARTISLPLAVFCIEANDWVAMSFSYRAPI